MCTSSFCRSLLSSLSSVIHSLEFLVTSYSSHLAIFLPSLVLESPVVGSNFPESFIHGCLTSPYLLNFSLLLQ